MNPAPAAVARNTKSAVAAEPVPAPPTELIQNLPSWARFIAQDADGSWWAYEVEPLRFDKGWYENELGRRFRLGQSENNHSWEVSLCSTKSIL